MFSAHVKDSGGIDDIINNLRIVELNLITISINDLDYIGF